MLRPYPSEQEFQKDEAAEAEIAWLQQIVGEIRRIRAEMEVPHQKKVVALLSGGNDRIRAWAKRNAPYIVGLARLSSLTWLPAGEPDPEAVVAIVDELRVLLPMKDLVERDAELRRIAKTLEELDEQLAKNTAKLANPRFLGARSSDRGGTRAQTPRQRQAGIYRVANPKAASREPCKLAAGSWGQMSRGAVITVCILCTLILEGLVSLDSKTASQLMNYSVKHRPKLVDGLFCGGYRTHKNTYVRHSF